MTNPALSASAGPRLSGAFFEAVRQQGIRWTRDVLAVSVQQQKVWHYQRMDSPGAASPERRHPPYAPVAVYRSSTSRFGIGQVNGSRQTPLGLHRVAKKVGGGWPVGAAFTGRQMMGYTWTTQPHAPITNRIFWLEGLEPGFNRGGDVDTFRRYVYIHGTGEEPTLGRPASQGCIHLSADDLFPLYDRLPVGTLVWIAGR